MLKLTGPQLFLRYAWPCAEDKLRTGKITAKECSILEHWIFYPSEPDTRLLTKCFPKAEEALKKHAQYFELEEWSFENVSGYWRSYHGHSDECAVTEEIVFSIKDKKIVLVRDGGKFVVNWYGIKLREGDSIYVHRRVIIEKNEFKALFLK